MAKRLTPIERVISGSPLDRRERYARSLPQKGLTRVSVIVPTRDTDRLKAFARELRDGFADPSAAAANARND